MGNNVAVPKPNKNVRQRTIRLQKMMKNYNSWMDQSFRSDTTTNLQVSVLHYLVKMAALWTIEDSALIIEILNSIFDTDGHFSGIFHSATCQNYSENAATGECIANDSEKNCQEGKILRYFLSHAYKSRVLFEGLRMADILFYPPASVPSLNCISALYRPYILMVLLQFGAFIEIKKMPYESFSDTNRFQVIFFLRFIIENIWAKMWDSTDIDNILETAPNLKELIATATLLLRVIPQINLVNLDYIFYSKVQKRFVRLRDISGVVQKFSSMHYIPNLWNRVQAPSELKHFSRCAIRKCLNKNWALPDGIDELPIPVKLKSYLNLCYD